MTEKIAKVKIHQVYKTGDGSRVPSVTTVLGLLEKPGLHYWIAETTKAGLDWAKVRDTAGDIGSLLHYFILCDLKGEKPDTGEYSAQAIEKAEGCLIRWWDWMKGHKLEPKLIEQPLVSEQYRYGGTPDFVGFIDGTLTLLDFKTSKAIYSEVFYQMAGYRQLLNEKGIDIQAARILRIGRDEEEGFEDRLLGSLDIAWEVFHRCLEIYTLQKQIK